MKRSILQHPRWTDYRPFFALNRYDRDKMTGSGRPRIEVRGNLEPKMREDLLHLETTCPYCDAPVLCIRQRVDGSMYFAAACKLEDNVGCSRSRAASLEYAAVVADIEQNSGKGPGKRPTPVR